MAEKQPGIYRLTNRSDLSFYLGLTAGLFFFIASGLISYLNTKTFNEGANAVAHTHEVILSLGNLLSILKDAETGQRGYIITGNENYLEPYKVANSNLEESLINTKRLIKETSSQQANFITLQTVITTKMNELAESITLRRTQGFAAAHDFIMTDRGRTNMDAIRSIIREMQQTEQDIRAQRIIEMREAYRIALISGILTALIGMALTIAVAYLVRRSVHHRKRLDWLQAGKVGLSTAMLGDQRTEQLGNSILKFLAEYLDAQAGVMFVKEEGDYRRIASYGVPEVNGLPDRFKLGDGLLGQAAKDGRTFLLRETVKDQLTIGFAFGTAKPRHIIISPAHMDSMVNAVIELGFVHPVENLALEFLKDASDSIGIAVRSASYRAHLQNLLEETQRQSEELQTQSEELRVSNEELEEQSRALQESQSRMEQQQAEMEQTNAQLEEHTRLLETQRDDLEKAKADLQLRSRELEQASQYKSDFLANMSHELRTPLNSSLILAKLLADNSDGNLTDEQIRYAETIQSAGNDLLALINDILDLSKIEAGHMEIQAETLRLSSLADDLQRTFGPVAQQKGLTIDFSLTPGTPDTIETDGKRLEQVLKNLLSNAIKFTETGQVGLTIHKEGDQRIAFTVRDTGIGIDEKHQQVIFEAFRQADGTTNRKYGGTGLGLSISRELVRLLGGEIRLESKAGEGSTFTVILPQTYSAGNVKPRQLPAAEPKISMPEPTGEYGQARHPSPIASAYSSLPDDRDQLTGTQRVILIVEDDESFAQILYDLAHELRFQCLMASSAEDALRLAEYYLPSAVILDVGLPDHSGLSVLDRLKQNAKTRHIPVHVVSANDHSQTAYSLGAVGYMLKPVKRLEIATALEKLEEKLVQRMRRVLVVEDDKVQRESVQKLLASQAVETVGAGTAAECLALLKDQTFDCMVLDLTLPDASGYSLLETLSEQNHTYSFPPVIVYTGRELSADEEQQLRRYSKSIIIKGAKSPERLLDEVTLFLHQVVSELPAEQQKMLKKAKSRDAILEGRRILVVEDDIRNVYALTSILEPRGAFVQIARNGREALTALEKSKQPDGFPVDLVLMDVMMPEMDGLTATREIRKQKEWKKLPIIVLTAKAMKDDQERCIDAGANDYMAKPLDVEKLLSLVRVWMPR